MPTLIGYLNHHVHHFTASHPLYRSLIDFPPDGYKIVEGDDDADNYPAWVPTCPVKTHRKHFVFIEDWHTLFDCGNGKSAEFDIQGPAVQEKKKWLAQENVLGILTHMQGTVADCVTLFGQELAHKIHYVPLALPLKHFHRRPSDKVRFLWTSSHGGHGQESCWRLRGGPETKRAFDLLNDPRAALTMIGAAAEVTDNRVFYWPQSSAIPAGVPSDKGKFLSEEVIHNLYSDNDVFVIPSVRIHSVAAARAMMYAMPLICSDGWGYREFVEDRGLHFMGDHNPAATGFLCPGQNGLTSWHDRVFREDYSKMPPLNEKLAENVATAMKRLLDRDLLARMSQAALAASERFSIDNRNRILKSILDKHLS